MGTTNFELDNYAKLLNIKYYKPACMKDVLINQTPDENECRIVNTESSDSDGKHWVLYWKKGENKVWYSSYGDYPDEILIKYLGKNILSSTTQIQSFNGDDMYDCGLYCIVILYLLSLGYEFEDIIIQLM